MPNIGAPEILVIALVALLLFGGLKLADIGKGLGQGIKNFKQGLRESEEIGKKSDDDKADKKEPEAKTKEA